MFTQRTFRICTLLALMLLLFSGFAGAQPQSPVSSQAGAGKVSLDFKDIELPELIQTISELTGKNFLYDESVKGKVTIISPDSMTLDEAYKLFQTVLNVKGYTIVPSGRVNKIVSTREAKESNLPTVTGATGTEQYVTRLVPLKNVDAAEIAGTVLAPLIPKTSNIVAYSPTNTLIITDSAANISRLVRILRQLDVESSADVMEVISLEFAGADEVAEICNQMLAEGAPSGKKTRQARNVKSAGAKTTGRVIPYERTNSLVVMASVEELESIRELIRSLDQRPAQERAHINVYYLENADAETLGKTLNEILTGIKTKTQATAKNGAQKAAAALSTEHVAITADKPTNSLIINATPKDYQIIQGIIRRLDIKRKQVFVEALILELSMDATKRLGVSLQGAVETGSDSVSYFSTGPSAVNPLIPDDDGTAAILKSAVDGILLGGLFNPITITDPSDSEKEIEVPALSALIDLSKTDSDVNILSAPRLLTSDNEEAEIIVGSNVPIITSTLTDTGGSTGLAQSSTVERQDVALTLRFTPQITEGDLVRLNVYQEITGIAANAVGNVDEVGPTLTKRLVRNTVLAENGKTVVLGGLISTDKQNTVSKVPFLGDLPVIGWLFKTKTDTETKTNLLVFITPKIIRSSDDLMNVTRQHADIIHDLNTGEMPTTVTELPFSEPMNAPADSQATVPGN